MLGDLRGFMPDVYTNIKRTNKAGKKGGIYINESSESKERSVKLIPEKTQSMLSHHYLLPNIDVNDYTNYLTDNNQELKDKLNNPNDSVYSNNISRLKESLADLNGKYSKVEKHDQSISLMPAGSIEHTQNSKSQSPFILSARNKNTI
jgi:hypothetical protein